MVMTWIASFIEKMKDKHLKLSFLCVSGLKLMLKRVSASFVLLLQLLSSMAD